LSPWCSSSPLHMARTRHPGSGQIPGEDLAVASWAPIIKGLTPHGKRHGHKVWMDEDQVADVLKSERLGHDEPGMRGVYGHVSRHARGTEGRAASTLGKVATPARRVGASLCGAAAEPATSQCPASQGRRPLAPYSENYGLERSVAGVARFHCEGTCLEKSIACTQCFV